jgi:hypothetical protein
MSMSEQKRASSFSICRKALPLTFRQLHMLLLPPLLMLSTQRFRPAQHNGKTNAQ